VRLDLRHLALALRLLFLHAPLLRFHTHRVVGSLLRGHCDALLRRTLERCGPVGIKWGQWASTRYDLFEDDLCDELHKLTNSAPAHSIAHTRAVVAADFGCELSDLFATFEDKPMASGSIGQVRAQCDL
jgi:aarF domain-containing kinase